MILFGNQISVPELTMKLERGLVIGLSGFNCRLINSKIHVFPINSNLSHERTAVLCPVLLKSNTTKSSSVVHPDPGVHGILGVGCRADIISAAVKPVSINVVNLFVFWKSRNKTMKSYLDVFSSISFEIFSGIPAWNMGIGVPCFISLCSMPFKWAHEVAISVVYYRDLSFC